MNLTQILNSKLFIFILGVLVGASLLFLALNKDSNEQESNATETQGTIMRARKERDTLMVQKDSVTKVINKHQKQKERYNKIDEKVNRIVNVATDIQLDSILTNFKYIPLNK